VTPLAWGAVPSTVGAGSLPGSDIAAPIGTEAPAKSGQPVLLGEQGGTGTSGAAAPADLLFPWRMMAAHAAGASGTANVGSEDSAGRSAGAAVRPASTQAVADWDASLVREEVDLLAQKDQREFVQVDPRISMAGPPIADLGGMASEVQPEQAAAGSDDLAATAQALGNGVSRKRSIVPVTASRDDDDDSGDSIPDIDSGHEGSG
jgi:hypothetical protein